PFKHPYGVSTRASLWQGLRVHFFGPPAPPFSLNLSPGAFFPGPSHGAAAAFISHPSPVPRLAVRLLPLLTTPPQCTQLIWWPQSSVWFCFALSAITANPRRARR